VDTVKVWNFLVVVELQHSIQPCKHNGRYFYESRLTVGAKSTATHFWSLLATTQQSVASTAFKDFGQKQLCGTKLLDQTEGPYMLQVFSKDFKVTRRHCPYNNVAKIISF